MFEYEFDQFYSFIQIHEETHHIWVHHRDRPTDSDPVDKKHDDRFPGTHHIAVPRTANYRISPLHLYTDIDSHNMLHHCLAGIHSIDQIRRLVGVQEGHLFTFTSTAA